jgi:2-keto-4-pentenoate hydratase/2-oxohepta-3-ene-1,7-dioic acid hydratase in catechol pathway
MAKCIIKSSVKLVTFRMAGGREGRAPVPGVLVDGGTKVAVLPGFSSILEIVEGGQNALDRAHEALKHSPALLGVGNVTLLAPIPQPPQMRDFLCFEKHLTQAFHQARKLKAAGTPDPEAAMREMEQNGILVVPKIWYERPICYHPNRLCVTGPETDVPWPVYCNALDFELEFGCYIGRMGRDITRDNARQHIAGYTIFNDFSARDEQTKEMPGQLGPGKGKDFDNGNAMGPCLVTADEIGDPYSLDMAVRVNGEEWGRGNSRDMHWKFEDCIAHVARSETLYPGEFFGSGTVGNGCGLEHMRFLKDGDVVELEVEKIGILRNRVVKQVQ